MKKIVSLILIAALSISCAALSSCSDKKGDESSTASTASMGNKVGVQSGTTGASFMKGDAEWGFEGFNNIIVNPYDTAALAVSDMVAGNVDFVVVDNDVAENLAASTDGVKCIKDIALTTESYGIAVDKTQADLLTKINKFLTDKKADVEALFTKYKSVDDNNAANWKGDIVKSATYDSSKEQLVMATNAAFAPYEFVIGEGFAGIDVEMAKMLADYLGQELVIQNMEFDSITASLGKNGVDIGVAAMTINAARKKVVNFSDSYYDGAAQVILVKEENTTFDNCKTADEAINILKSLGK